MVKSAAGCLHFFVGGCLLEGVELFFEGLEFGADG